MVSHWNLSDSKSPRVSRTLHSTLTDLNNVVVRMVFTSPFISKSSTPYINLLMTEPRAPFTIGITVTFMFYGFFNSLARFFRFLSILLSAQPGQQSPPFVLFYSLQDFYTSVSSWTFTGVWVTASPFKSPGLFSVFWPTLKILWSGWSRLVLRFTTLPAPFY